MLSCANTPPNTLPKSFIMNKESDFPVGFLPTQTAKPYLLSQAMQPALNEAAKKEANERVAKMKDHW